MVIFISAIACLALSVGAQFLLKAGVSSLQTDAEAYEGLGIVGTVMAAATFLSLGFAIGAIASNVDSANMLSGMAVMPLIFLSGAWFPVDSLPGWLENVVSLLPLVPVMDALRAVSIAGGSIGDIGGELLQIAVWIPVTFAIAVAALRPKRTTAGLPEARLAEAVA